MRPVALRRLHRRQALRGAALLDRMIPGWERRIVLAQLDIRNRYRCVLGQLYGDYSAGTVALGLRDSYHASHYGFFAWQVIDRAKDWEHLAACWHTLITARKQGVTQPWKPRSLHGS